MLCLKYCGAEKLIGQWRLRAAVVFLQFSEYIKIPKTVFTQQMPYRRCRYHTYGGHMRFYCKCKVQAQCLGLQ